MDINKRNLEIITIPTICEEYGVSREYITHLAKTVPNEIGLLPRQHGDAYRFVRGRWEEYLLNGKFYEKPGIKNR